MAAALGRGTLADDAADLLLRCLTATFAVTAPILNHSLHRRAEAA
jgi:hypothetical protein